MAGHDRTFCSNGLIFFSEIGGKMTSKKRGEKLREIFLAIRDMETTVHDKGYSVISGIALKYSTLEILDHVMTHTPAVKETQEARQRYFDVEAKHFLRTIKHWKRRGVKCK